MAKTHPIVLAHGIARFDALTNKLFKIDNRDGDDELHYFRNIRTHLQHEGFTVQHSHVEWARGLDVRSKTLRREVERILAEEHAEKVHIIAHSMGGLDTRHMLFDSRDDGFHERVASLTTLGSPHFGSPVADFMVQKMGNIVSLFGLPIEGVHDLTAEACRAFHEKADAWESECGVRFRAYAGAQNVLHIFSPLKVAWGIINSVEGPNDGLASVKSARWKDEYFVEPVLEADHLNLLGWWDPSEVWQRVSRAELETRIKQVYLDIANDLATAFPVG